MTRRTKSVTRLWTLLLAVTLAACNVSPAVTPSALPVPATPVERPVEPTAVPTDPPTAVSTATAAEKPTATPTSAPTIAPTSAPETQATIQPTQSPDMQGSSSGWWNDTVFYEVFVRSFNDSDGNGIGDIIGLIEKLDYLNDGDPATTADLGVTGIWLMPITESPSYHGYDVVDYYSVDQGYGTEEDFKRLVEEAHKRGIRVIMDLVLNHTGANHPWFKASSARDPQYRDWYIWADSAPSYRGPWNQQVWHAKGGEYFYAVFNSGMPDLNLENPEVTAEIQQITRFWLEKMNVDGFRLDAIEHYVEDGADQENTPATHAWLQGFHTYIKSLDAEAFTVGEAIASSAEVLEYIGDEVDIAFEFDLAGDFVNSARGPSAAAASDQLKLVLQNFPNGQYGVFLTNHDQNRVMSVIGDDARAKLAATLLLTAPGVPFIYYGEEIGMIGTKPDEDLRRPMQWDSESNKAGFTTGMPWRSPARDYPERSVALQTNDPSSLLSHYRALIALRNTYTALRTGSAWVVDSGSPFVYALLRYAAQEAFLVLVNVSADPVPAGQYNLKLGSGPLSGDLQATLVFGEGEPAPPQLNAAGGFDGYQPLAEIPGTSSVIIRLTP